MAKTNRSVIYIFVCWCSGYGGGSSNCCYHRLIVNIFVYLVTICDSKSPYKVILIFICFFLVRFFSHLVFTSYTECLCDTMNAEWLCVCVSVRHVCVYEFWLWFWDSNQIQFTLLWSFTGMILHCMVAAAVAAILTYDRICVYEHSYFSYQIRNDLNLIFEIILLVFFIYSISPSIFSMCVSISTHRNRFDWKKKFQNSLWRNTNE